MIYDKTMKKLALVCLGLLSVPAQRTTMKTCCVRGRPSLTAALVSLGLFAWLTLPLARLVAHAQEARFFRVGGPVASTITAFGANGYVT